MERQQGGDPPLSVPDLRSLGLPPAEEALLRLVLGAGASTTGDAAGRLGMSGAAVSRAAAGLRNRGFLLAGVSRSYGAVLAPLDAALDALVAERRQRAERDLADLERTRDALLARRLAERSAAFSLYDDMRLEVPLWRLEASGWSDEPGEVRAAVRLFALLWAEAEPWPGERVVDGAPRVPLERWRQPPRSAAPRPGGPGPVPSVVGSAP